LFCRVAKAVATPPNIESSGDRLPAAGCQGSFVTAFRRCRDRVIRTASACSIAHCGWTPDWEKAMKPQIGQRLRCASSASKRGMGFEFAMFFTTF
jgi:hypothetical protein